MDSMGSKRFMGHLSRPGKNDQLSRIFLVISDILSIRTARGDSIEYT
jgi:hypothetical protein